MAAGCAPDTPVAAVRNGTRPEQQTVRATLATIGDADVRAPSAIVVGAVAALDLAWFEPRPLFGRTHRRHPAREQASELRARLEALGAEVRRAAARSRSSRSTFTLPDLDAYAWLVFTSANGVERFFDRGLRAAGSRRRVARPACGSRRSVRHRGRARGAGHRRRPRARALRRRVAARRRSPTRRAGERVLLARAEQARDVLPDGLGARGYDGRRAPRLPHRHGDARSRRRSRRSAPARSTRSRSRRRRRSATSATSSGRCPTRSRSWSRSVRSRRETARDRGLRVDAEAAEHTIDGLVAALLGARSAPQDAAYQ